MAAEGSGDDDGEDSDGLEDDGEAETTSSEYADPLGRIAELEDEIKLLNTCCKHYSNGKAAAERRVNELETEIHRLENDLNVKQHEALKSSRRHEAEVQKLHADLGTREPARLHRCRKKTSPSAPTMRNFGYKWPKCRRAQRRRRPNANGAATGARLPLDG